MVLPNRSWSQKTNVVKTEFYGSIDLISDRDELRCVQLKGILTHEFTVRKLRNQVKFLNVDLTTWHLFKV